MDILSRYEHFPDPVTLMIVAGTGLMAAGQIKEGQAASAEAKSQKNIANYNAQLMESQAVATEAASRYKQKKQGQEGERIKGSLLAKLGASGADITQGAPVDLMAEQATELEQESAMIGYEGQLAAAQARSQATIDRMQAKIYGQKAKTVKTASYLSAGATLLTGLGTAGYMSGAPGTKTGILKPNELYYAPH